MIDLKNDNEDDVIENQNYPVKYEKRPNTYKSYKSLKEDILTKNNEKTLNIDLKKINRNTIDGFKGKKNLIEKKITYSSQKVKIFINFFLFLFRTMQ